MFMTKALVTNIVLLGFKRLHGIVSHARVGMYAAISGSEGRTFGDFLWGILETRGLNVSFQKGKLIHQIIKFPFGQFHLT